jgi:hypothetical protein
MTNIITSKTWEFPNHYYPPRLERGRIRLTLPGVGEVTVTVEVCGKEARGDFEHRFCEPPPTWEQLLDRLGRTAWRALLGAIPGEAAPIILSKTVVQTQEEIYRRSGNAPDETK